MFTEALFGRIPSDVIVAFGACDQDLVAEILQTSKARVIWLSPREGGAPGLDERLLQAARTDCLLYLVGDAKTTLPALGSILANQQAALLFADLDGEIAAAPQAAQEVIALVRELTGKAPTTLLAVRQGERTAARMGALLSALPEQAFPTPPAGTGTSWLFAAGASAAGPAAVRPHAGHSGMHTCFCDGGLANRLNTLLFALVLRDRFQHRWEISWPRNNWCGASFGSLFDIDAPVSEHPLAHFKQNEDQYWFLAHENQGGFDEARITYHRGLSDYPAYEAVLDGHPNVCYLHHLIPDFATLADLQAALRHLRVKPHLMSAAVRFCRERAIDASVIGLHIRKTDFGNLVDDNELFTLVSQNPNRFFVCSDDAEVTRRFSQLKNCHVLEKAHYPEKLVEGEGWNSWIVDNEGRQFPFNVKRSEEAIVEALLDLLILSRTTPMMASSSTFFRMALIFNKTGYFQMQEEYARAAGAALDH